MPEQLSVQDNAVILDLLQQFVNLETTSRNLYWARSVYWRNLDFLKLADYYQQQAAEDHAQVSADRMAFLGLQPKVEPAAVEMIQGTITEQFKVDLKVEIELAENYREAIKTAAAQGDHVTEDLWRGILKSTEEHVALLQKQLTQIELLGEGLYLASWKPNRKLI